MALFQTTTTQIMPVPFASPDSVKYVGATPSYMTPHTPKTPDEYGSTLARKAGFPHLKPSREKDTRSKYQIQIDRYKESGVKRRKQQGSSFNMALPPEREVVYCNLFQGPNPMVCLGKPFNKDLLTIAQTGGVVSFGR